MFAARGRLGARASGFPVLVVACISRVVVGAKAWLAAGRRLSLLLGARLGPRAPRDVRLLATSVPAAAGDGAVIETDEIAQLVELLLGELAGIAHAQVVERQVRERDPLQLVDAITERLDHAVDLAVFSLVDRDAEPRVLALAGEHL